jgi:hypothetical protein
VPKRADATRGAKRKPPDNSASYRAASSRLTGFKSTALPVEASLRTRKDCSLPYTDCPNAGPLRNTGNTRDKRESSFLHERTFTDVPCRSIKAVVDAYIAQYRAHAQTELRYYADQRELAIMRKVLSTTHSRGRIC